MNKKRVAKTDTEEDLLELGKFYFLNQKYDKAIAEFQKALEINDQNAETCYNLGLAYETKGQFDRARELYEKALSINPNHKLAQEHLNKLLGIN